MKTNQNSAIVMFIWLTIGYAVIHICLGWSAFGYLETSLRRSTYHETLQLADDGEPFIQGWSYNQDVSYRRLDGTQLTNVRPQQVNSIWFSRAVNREPYSWSFRVQSFSDYQNPATNWYLIAAPDQPGTAYFEGFDRLTRRHVGYLGTNGFTMQIPTLQNRFPVRTSATMAFYDILTTAAEDHVYHAAVEPQGDAPSRNAHVDRASGAIDDSQFDNASVDRVWLLSHDTIYEIQLGSRSVRPLLKVGPDVTSLNQVTIMRDGHLQLRLVGLGAKGLIFIDPKTGETESLATELQPNDRLHQLKNGQRVLIRWPGRQFEGHYRLTWWNSAGEMTRQEEVQLNSTPPNRLLMAVMSAVVGPSPIVSLFAAAVNASVLNSYEETSNFAIAVAKSINEMKIWLISSWVVAILCGWACRRRELMVFQSHGWFWPITVGLCGWFGWMGYICVRPLPPRHSNRQFFSAVPDPVRPLGTEIFA